MSDSRGSSSARQVTASEIRQGQFIARTRGGRPSYVVSRRLTEKSVVLTLRQAAGITGPIRTYEARPRRTAKWWVVKP